MHHVDVQTFQQRRRADARTLQNLRRGDGAGAQQHFAARFGMGQLIAVALQIVDAHCALAVEHDMVGQRMGDDLQVRPGTRLIQITAGGAGAASLRRHGAIHRAEAFLLVTVQIVSARVTRLHAGFHHGVEQFVVTGLRRGDAHRALTTVVIVRADIARFRLTEIRQAVQIGPVFQTRRLGPVVEIHRVAANVTHAVDQG